MKTQLRAAFTICALALTAAAAYARVPATPKPARAPQAAPTAQKSPVMTAMELELDRSMTTLKAVDPAPYFIGYTVTDQQRAEVQGSNGALLHSFEGRSRFLETRLRVGTYELDNTRRVGDRDSQQGLSPGMLVPTDDDIAVLRRAIWIETDHQYRTASEALLRIRTGREVRVEAAEGQAPDFSREKPQVSIGPGVSFTLDRKPWEERVRAITKIFRASPDVLNSIANFSATADNQYQATSEGTRIQFGQVRYRLEMFLQRNYVPVVSPVGFLDDGSTIPLEPDQVASEIAVTAKASTSSCTAMPWPRGCTSASRWPSPRWSMKPRP